MRISKQVNINLAMSITQPQCAFGDIAL